MHTVSPSAGTVQSEDGTRIAYDRAGTGPVLILVDGATQYRAFDQSRPELLNQLAPHFTVVSYDRRGRGESTDTLPFAVEREIEDIEALIGQVGSPAFLYGISSGAALAMEAAIRLEGKVKGLAMYEPPYNNDPGFRQTWREYTRGLNESLSAGRRGDAVAHFMKLVGASPEDVNGMRQSPVWAVLEAIAPTLAYDRAALGEDATVPTDRAARVQVPTLVMNGSASYPFMQETAAALAKALPRGQHRVLEGQTHGVDPQVLAPALVGFFLLQPAQSDQQAA